ncbi:MAG: HAMP domain-containing histidine kinase [Bacteroidetes bacterium]|nr:HAMP domain-containing histidine kinase [Bacteroidota bacterium]
MSLNQFLIGNRKIETEYQIRKLLLTAYVLIMYLAVHIYFLVANLFNPDSELLFIFVGVLISILCIFLLRAGHTNLSIAIHLIRAALTPLYFSLIEGDAYLTGSYLYFLAGCHSAIAIFGIREWRKGMAYVIVVTGVFLILFLEPHQFRPSHPHFYFISTFVILLALGSLIVLFFDHLSSTSENRIVSKNKELEKVNAELDHFVYRTSHDLRAPLSSILGLTEIAAKTDEVEELKKYFIMIKERVQVQDEFIQQIISYSRNTRVDKKPEPIILREFVLQTIDLLIFSPAEEALTVSTDIAHDLTLVTDKARLRAVLSNLISNALKYQDTFKPKHFIKISANVSSTQLDIFVEDNGIGIDTKYQQKIFQMFYRATDRSKGSGLGLYIAQEAAIKMGGTLTFKSELGVGSCFTLSLPKEDSTA